MSLEIIIYTSTSSFKNEILSVLGGVNIWQLTLLDSKFRSRYSEDNLFDKQLSGKKLLHHT